MTQQIRTKPSPLCICCQSEGTYLYKNLKDRLFGVVGEWHLKKCNNNECGLIWQDPMPIEEDLGFAYQSYYTHQDALASVKCGRLKQCLKDLYLSAKQSYLANKYGYSTTKVGLIYKLLGYLLYLTPNRRASVDFEVFYLDALPSGGKLLEIGCGSGVMLKGMQDRGWQVEGLDFDSQAVSNANHKGLKVRLGGLVEQDYLANSFDAIVMSHVIEHVYNPIQIIEECYRLLKPKGRLILITPNNFSLGHAKFKNNWRGLEPPRHLNIFNSQTLIKLLKINKFNQVSATTTIRDANNLFIASESLKSNGAYTMGSYTNTYNKIKGLFMQYVEWVWLSFDDSVGEELVIKATK